MTVKEGVRFYIKDMIACGLFLIQEPSGFLLVFASSTTSESIVVNL